MLGDIQELNTREEVSGKNTLCFHFWLVCLNLYIICLLRQSYPKSTAGQKRSWRSRYFPTLCLIIHCSETKITHSWENTNKNTHAHFQSGPSWTGDLPAVQILCRYVVPALDNQRLFHSRGWTEHVGLLLRSQTRPTSFLRGLKAFENVTSAWNQPAHVLRLKEQPF